LLGIRKDSALPGVLGEGLGEALCEALGDPLFGDLLRGILCGLLPFLDALLGDCALLLAWLTFCTDDACLYVGCVIMNAMFSTKKFCKKSGSASGGTLRPRPACAMRSKSSKPHMDPTKYARTK
jgi:hypothetical protein